MRVAVGDRHLCIARTLDPRSLDVLPVNGWVVHTVPTIKTIPCATALEIAASLECRTDVVISSRTTVDLLIHLNLLQLLHDRSVHVVGHGTAELLRAHGVVTTTVALNIERLQEALHADRRVTQWTSRAGIERELTIPGALVVPLYDTVLLRPRLDTVMTCTMLFSPSGVESLLANNPFSALGRCYVMGLTTAQAARDHGIEPHITGIHRDQRVFLSTVLEAERQYATEE